jgi:deoxycytidylate deaminase
MRNSYTRLMRSVRLYVIRWNGSSFTMSKPCNDCVKYMTSIGLKKVYYSNAAGTIVYESVSKMTNNYTTSAHQFKKKIIGKKIK